MHAAGLLEFERRLVGDRRRGAAAEDEQRIVRGKRRRDLHPVAADRLGEMHGQFAKRCKKRPVAGPFAEDRKPGDGRRHEGLGGGDALFQAGADIDGMMRGDGKRRAGGVGQRDRQRAAVAHHPCHRDDIGALAGLRDGDAGRLRELQPGAIDRGDRRAERGHGKPGAELDRIFQEGSSVVGRAARHRGEEARIELTDVPSGPGQGIARPVEQASHGIGDFGDLALHMGGGHQRAPCSAGPLNRNSATKS